MGVKLQMVHYENRIGLIPVRSSQSLHGALKGINTDVPRQADRA